MGLSGGLASNGGIQAASSGGVAVEKDLWLPTGVLVENIPRRLMSMSSFGPLSTGRLSLVGGAIVPANVTISSITFYASATGAGTPTNQWFCLTDLSLNVLRKTSDDTSNAWNANAKKTLNLATDGSNAAATTYTPSVDTAVYIGIMVAATTVPTTYGWNMTTGTGSPVSDAPAMAGTSTTGLTTPASLGATAAAITSNGNLSYAYLA